jgi:phi LC3 family holin
MKINWRVRLLNPTFWIAAIPATLLLAQAILALFGVQFDIEPLNAQLLAIVDALFVLLVILGVVADPTTQGVSDSALAQTYEQPKAKE